MHMVDFKLHNNYAKVGSMNAKQRKELKRRSTSQGKWRQKAIERGSEIRFLKDKMDDLTKSRKFWRNKAQAAEDVQKKSRR